MGCIYIAGPLSHENPAVVHARAEVHEEAAVLMTNLGLTVYSPIASWYHLSKRWDMSTCPHDWEHHNWNHLLRCSLIRVLDLPGFEESVGTNMEREWAKQIGIREEMYNPEHLKAYQHFYKTLRA